MPDRLDRAADNGLTNGPVDIGRLRFYRGFTRQLGGQTIRITCNLDLACRAYELSNRLGDYWRSGGARPAEAAR